MLFLVEIIFSNEIQEEKLNSHQYNVKNNIRKLINIINDKFNDCLNFIQKNFWIIHEISIESSSA